MKNKEVLSIVKRASWNAESYAQSAVVKERDDALKRYLGERYGDEVEGRSTVISRDVLETVEWIMPSLLRVFTAGGDVVRYDPVESGDEDIAEQATDYANFIFNKDNDGFLVFDTWFRDALIQKVGVVKTVWEDEEAVTTEQYEGLSEDEFISIASDHGVKVVAHTAYPGGNIAVSEGGAAQDPAEQNKTAPMSPQSLDIGTLHDVKIRRTVNKGRVKILNVPPEEFFISSRAKSIDDADYIEHRTRKTRSELVAEGFDRSIVDRLPVAADYDAAGERQIRNDGYLQDADSADKTMQEVTVRESYTRIDRDADGIAEHVKVIWSDDRVLDVEEIDCHSFATLCPIRIPHRFYGLSAADLVLELQRIKTVLMRQTLDNLYLSNTPEREIDMTKIEDISDYMEVRPGGIKRVRAIGASREIVTPFVADRSMGIINAVDGMMAKRTGVTEGYTGVDAEALQNQSATSSNNAQAAASQRMEMIARIFAETGVKKLFKDILRLTVRHQDKARTIRLRNKWVPIDPRTWNAEMDVTINVGLGHGNRDKQAAMAGQIINLQKEMLQLGIVKPKHVFHAIEKFVESAGFKSADPFFDDPGDAPMPQPPQGNGQGQDAAKQAESQANIQAKQAEIQANIQAKQAEIQANIQIKRDEMQSKAQLEVELARHQMDLKKQQMEAEFALKQKQMEMEAALKQQQMAYEASVSTKIDGVHMGGQVG